MCVTFLLLNPEAKRDDEWQFVLINNRDEEYSRPTEPASWKDNLLCGRDMYSGKEGGTWLGMSKTGRVAVLMNIIPPNPNLDRASLKGRGFLVRNFVTGDQLPVDYASNLAKQANTYDGFALVLLNKSSTEDAEVPKWNISYFNNVTSKAVENLKAGIYGFGNSPRETPLLKVQYGLNLFQQVCQKHLFDPNVDTFVEDLLTILTDKRKLYPDPILSKYQSDKTESDRQHLSSCFVEFPPERAYGTRTHTIILIDGLGQTTYVERNLDDPNAKTWKSTKHEFHLQKEQFQQKL